MATLQTTSITGSLNISSSGLNSGSTLLAVDGFAGRVFSVIDTLSGSLFSVAGNSGVPIIEVFSDQRVNIGQFNGEAIKVQVSGSDVALGSGSVLFVSSSKNVGINAISFDANAREALLVSSSTYNIISADANLNNYAQTHTQNFNAGTAASSDVVATNNTGTELGNYVDLGINSSGYNAGFIGNANDAYLYSTGSEFFIGNASPGRGLFLFAGGVTNTASVFISSSGNVGIGTVAVSANKLNVAGNISASVITASLFSGSHTGSTFGTSSWATNAINAINATSATSATSATTATTATTAITANALNTANSYTIVGLTATGNISASGVLTASNINAAQTLGVGSSVTVGSTITVGGSSTFNSSVTVNSSISASSFISSSNFVGPHVGNTTGTASWATNAVSALSANTATTANALNTANNYQITSLYATGNITASNISASGFVSSSTLAVTTTTGQIARFGSISSVATATPVAISLGATYSTTAGANPKIKLWDDGSSLFGFGISSAQMDYQVPTGGEHVFYINGVQYARIGLNSTFNGYVGVGAAPATVNPGRLYIRGAGVAETTASIKFDNVAMDTAAGSGGHTFKAWLKVYVNNVTGFVDGTTYYIPIYS